MKRIIIFSLIILLVTTGIVYAVQHRHGMDPKASVNIEDLKKFQKETLTLRDELITKRFELQSEYNKPQRDYDRIAAIKKEIVDLRTKIEAIADKYGVKSFDPKMMADGRMMGGRGMMKRGMMGCPCPMCQ